MQINLKEAARFHGHLGPYLVLGILAGACALKKLRAQKYFGLKVKVWGVIHKPKSCLVDGLQLSTGATYGKGNIEKKAGSKILILFINTKNKQRLKVSLKDDLTARLDSLSGHKDSEELAKSLRRARYSSLFKLIGNT